MSSKQSSIREIAKKAGVSIATVSRVINQSGYYQPEMEKKVMDAVHELHYVPNMTARALRSNHKPFVGIVCTEQINQHFIDIIFQLQSNLLQKGYVSIVLNLSEGNVTLSEYGSMFSHNLSIIVFIGVQVHEILDAQFDVPCIFIECEPSQNTMSLYTVIQTDHFQAGYLGTEELIRQGCRKIVLLRSSQKNIKTSSKEKGYMQSLSEHGIQYDPNLIMYVDAFASAASAYEKLNLMIDQHIDFDAVYCNSDISATGIMRVLKEKNIDVPGKVKVIGYANSDISNYFDPPITSIDMGLENMVQIALQEILSLVSHKPTENKRITLPIQLLKRGTTC